MKEATIVSTHFNSSFRGSKHNIETAIWLYEVRKRSTVQIAKVFNIHPTTVQRSLKENGIAVLYNNKPSGSKNWNWKGGVTKNDIRFSTKYKQWRIAVFERDNYTCVWCNEKGRLQADHIKPQSLFPELRFELSNGRTLCIDCHKKTDTYGQRCKKLSRNDFV